MVNAAASAMVRDERVMVHGFGSASLRQVMIAALRLNNGVAAIGRSATTAATPNCRQTDAQNAGSIAWEAFTAVLPAMRVHAMAARSAGGIAQTERPATKPASGTIQRAAIAIGATPPLPRGDCPYH